MSYELHFKLEKEPQKPFNDNCEESKSDIIKYLIFHALQEYTIDKLHLFIRDFKSRINLLKFIAKNQFDSYIYSEYSNDKDVWFCGWEYSHKNYESEAEKMLSIASDKENELYMLILSYKLDSDVELVFELRRIIEEYLEYMYDYYSYKFCEEHKNEIIKEEEE